MDPEQQTCAPIIPSPRLSDCDILQKTFPDFSFGDDCCLVPYFGCADGRVVDISIGYGASFQSPTKINHILEKLKGLDKLESLDIYNYTNVVGNLDYKKLCRFKNLINLSLGGLDVNPNRLDSCIGTDLKNLVNLYLWKMNIQGPIPTEITKLKKLQTLDLSDNNLSGPIPNLQDFPDLFKVFLNNNKGLTGTITPNTLVKADPSNIVIGADWQEEEYYCDLSGTLVCLDEKYTGPDCFLSDNICTNCT